MKPWLKVKLCEAGAAALLVAGAVLIVGVNLPLINPGLFRWGLNEQGWTRPLSGTRAHQTEWPWSYPLIGTPLSLVLVITAWRLNVKGMRSRGES